MPKIMAQHPKTDTAGSIGSVVLGVLEVQVHGAFGRGSHCKCLAGLEVVCLQDPGLEEARAVRRERWFEDHLVKTPCKGILSGLLRILIVGLPGCV